MNNRQQPYNDLLDDIVASIISFNEKDKAVFRGDLKNMPKDDPGKLMNYVGRVKTITDIVSKKGQKPYYAWVAAFINVYDELALAAKDPAPADFYMDIFMGLLDRGLTAGNAFRYTKEAYHMVCDNPSMIKDGKYPTVDELFPRREDDRKK